MPWRDWRRRPITIWSLVLETTATKWILSVNIICPKLSLIEQIMNFRCLGNRLTMLLLSERKNNDCSRKQVNCNAKSVPIESVNPALAEICRSTTRQPELANLLDHELLAILRKKHLSGPLIFKILKIVHSFHREFLKYSLKHLPREGKRSSSQKVFFSGF